MNKRKLGTAVNAASQGNLPACHFGQGAIESSVLSLSQQMPTVGIATSSSQGSSYRSENCIASVKFRHLTLRRVRVVYL